ncbi:beta-glucosidase BglX [Flammeovirga yaeyamensis]|uniref:beta-glucosidase n=1 Tax=Flammeovirga yaeyamensis TaxID=367791 RepID=A0AAX1N6M4_9BACT|nr:beta-glucosidase BglX [Flammeovirga yaeyamensis]MBB3697804.1 beta-glucosidase [Flammeovirga yaeyamensis]NMF35840.1 beta-glucosidase BglX [Flammeovirga yaeyamensis]QWG03209.1 beta-glucosidase BglX [Flammeovirga yaeyamensis]
MKFFNYLLSTLFLLSAFGCQQTQAPKSDMDVFVDNLISQMTLEEKAGQLNLIPYEGSVDDPEFINQLENGRVGAILKSNGAARNRQIQEIAIQKSRLKIPIMFQEDVIHGYKTIAPVPLAEAASWNIQLIKESAKVAAVEAAASGIHLTYAPMVDISVDPRWGRVLEAGGEDVYLGSLISKARVEGFQGNQLDDPNTVMACVKHFAGYGASLAGRDYNIINFSDREMMETYVPPFKAAIDAGVGSVMCAYSAVQSIPATANKYLLTDLLKKELGFDGFLMTDWSTISNLVYTGVAENDTIAAKLALEAGIEMDMKAEVFVNRLPDMVRDGIVKEALVDNAVRKVLEAKYKLGLFQDPYSYFDETREKKVVMSADHQQKVKQMALESMVLLKNENVLPISEKKKNIVVVGPLAKTKKDLLGWWFCKGEEEDVISIYEGIEQHSSKPKLRFAQGCEIDSFRVAGKELIPQAVRAAKNADIIVAVIGEEYWMSGEGGGVANLRLPSAQEELIAELGKLGKPLVSVVVSGRPYVLTDIAEHSDAVLQAWMPGTMGGEAVAEILFGDFNPVGRLPMTFPIHEGQVPIYYNYRKTSHDFNAPDRYSTRHLDIPHEPLYPFGYGLSYAKFSYGEIELDKPQFSMNEELTASIEVTNMGEVEGTETVQMYIRDNVCQITRPVKELKGFQKVNLSPNEIKKVSFTITKDDLTYLDKDLKMAVDAGEFTLFIGPNSSENKQTTFTLK